MCSIIYQRERFQCPGKVSYKKEARKIGKSQYSTHTKGSVESLWLFTSKQVKKKIFKFLAVLFKIMSYCVSGGHFALQRLV